MKKYLVLKFKNAGLFTHKTTKDKIIDGTVRKRREDTQHFIEPITIYQVSNLLHVLFGERPVPTFKKVFYKPDQYLWEKAKSSYLKIDTPTKTLPNGQVVFIEEIMSTRKAVEDSWNKLPLIHWGIIRNFFNDKKDGDELFYEFVTVIEKALNIKGILELPIADVRLKILELQNNNAGIYNLLLKPLFIKLEKLRCKMLVSYILENKTDLIKQPSIALMTINGITKVSKLSGTIIVPITDDDIKRLSQCSGYATFLDNGAVSMEEIIDSTQLSTEDYKNVGNISIKKTNYLKFKLNEN